MLKISWNAFYYIIHENSIKMHYTIVYVLYNFVIDSLKGCHDFILLSTIF